MKKLVAAALAAIFIGSAAYAADNVIAPPDGLWMSLDKAERDAASRRGYGKVLGLTVETPASVDWGFTSTYVVVCVEAGLSTNDVVHMRIRSSDPSTSSDLFIDGAANQVAGSAIPLTGGGDGTDAACIVHPWRVDGLTFLSASVAATVDVSAF